MWFKVGEEVFREKVNMNTDPKDQSLVIAVKFTQCGTFENSLFTQISLHFLYEN